MSDKLGICSKCKEWTDPEDSCCGVMVWVEGGQYNEDDRHDIEEPKEEAKPLK